MIQSPYKYPPSIEVVKGPAPEQQRVWKKQLIPSILPRTAGSEVISVFYTDVHMGYGIGRYETWSNSIHGYGTSNEASPFYLFGDTDDTSYFWKSAESDLTRDNPPVNNASPLPYIALRLPGLSTISAYDIEVRGGQYTTEAPTCWDFQGSLDGKFWKHIQTIQLSSNNALLLLQQKLTFNVQHYNKEYYQYRWVFKHNNSETPASVSVARIRIHLTQKGITNSQYIYPPKDTITKPIWYKNVTDKQLGFVVHYSYYDGSVVSGYGRGRYEIWSNSISVYDSTSDVVSLQETSPAHLFVDNDSSSSFWMTQHSNLTFDIPLEGGNAPYVAIKLPGFMLITSYVLQCVQGDEHLAPFLWNIYGSTDKETWIHLGRHTASLQDWQQCNIKEFYLHESVSYTGTDEFSYFKWEFLQNNSPVPSQLCLKSLFIRGSPIIYTVLPPPLHNINWVSSQMPSSLNQLQPPGAWSGDNRTCNAYVDGHGNYDVWSNSVKDDAHLPSLVFDQRVDTWWQSGNLIDLQQVLTLDDTHPTIVIRLPAPCMLLSYVMQNPVGIDASNNTMPVTWQLRGSNDGVEYFTLDTVVNWNHWKQDGMDEHEFFILVPADIEKPFQYYQWVFFDAFPYASHMAVGNVYLKCIPPQMFSGPNMFMEMPFMGDIQHHLKPTQNYFEPSFISNYQSNQTSFLYALASKQDIIASDAAFRYHVITDDIGVVYSINVDTNDTIVTNTSAFTYFLSKSTAVGWYMYPWKKQMDDDVVIQSSYRTSDGQIVQALINVNKADDLMGVGSLAQQLTYWASASLDGRTRPAKSGGAAPITYQNAFNSTIPNIVKSALEDDADVQTFMLGQILSAFEPVSSSNFTSTGYHTVNLNDNDIKTLKLNLNLSKVKFLSDTGNVLTFNNIPLHVYLGNNATSFGEYGASQFWNTSSSSVYFIGNEKSAHWIGCKPPIRNSSINIRFYKRFIFKGSKSLSVRTYIQVYGEARVRLNGTWLSKAASSSDDVVSWLGLDQVTTLLNGVVLPGENIIEVDLRNSFSLQPDADTAIYSAPCAFVANIIGSATVEHLQWTDESWLWVPFE